MALRRGILHFIPAGPLFLFTSRGSGTLFNSWVCHYSSFGPSQHNSCPVILLPQSTLSLPLCPLFLPCLLLQGSGQPFVQLKLPSFVCAAFFILVLIAMVVCLSWTPYFTLSSPLFDTPPLIRIPILGPL